MLVNSPETGLVALTMVTSLVVCMCLYITASIQDICVLNESVGIRCRSGFDMFVYMGKARVTG